MKHLNAVLSLALVSCSSHSVVDKKVQNIQIDKGTVFISVSEQLQEGTHQITTRPQGSCIPEVKIVQRGSLTEVVHVKECFGRGYNQGTYFDVLLAPGYAYSISLKAGQIIAPDIQGADGIRDIHSSVTVGGIHGGTAEGKVTRTLLLGARVHLHNPEASQNTQLALHVNYGGIDFRF
ncbi:hypothetical protein [Rheinheimera sp. NSM]|uniref:hypothetical protein n=1 Tax=Rheinheimera sp. NSM TaxID=3457884 RepID=UPI004035F002